MDALASLFALFLTEDDNSAFVKHVKDEAELYVAHLAAVWVARSEDVMFWETVLLLQMTHQFYRKTYIVALPSLLGMERVADGPTGHISEVLRTARIADGKSILVGNGVKPETCCRNIVSSTYGDRGSIDFRVASITLLSYSPKQIYEKK